MTVVTVTVNHWNIRHNAFNPDDPKPVICLNRYEWVNSGFNRKTAKVWRKWGPKIGETEHHFDYDVPAGHMIYDPVNKTPCGASCWMEYEE